MTKETKVGIFVVACILSLLALSSLMGNIHLFKKHGINVTFEVNSAAGLVPLSKVKYRGIVVGDVKKITLDGGKVYVSTIIEAEYNIPDNVVVAVAQDGIMGNKFIDLVLKTDPSVTYLKDGGIYTDYIPPLSLEDLAEKVSEIADNVKIFTGGLNEVFSTADSKADMAAIIKNLKITTENLKNITADNEKKIDNLVSNLDRFAARMDRVFEKEEDNVSDSLANLKVITEDAKLAIAHINRITEGASTGEGTIGMLLTDNETRDKLKNAVNGLNDMVEKANQIVFEIEGGLDYLARHDEYHGSVGFRIMPSDNRYYMFGISNKPYNLTEKETTTITTGGPTPGTVFEKKSTKDLNAIGLTAQYAMRFNDKMFTVRGGLIESTIGFGFDFYPLSDDSLRFSLEAYDFYRDKYGVLVKANARYTFLDNFFVQAGWTEIGNARSSFTFGGGVRLIDNDLKYVIGLLPLTSMGN